MDDIKTEYVERQVIEDKLLTALEDGGSHVAIVASEGDLKLFITALMAYSQSCDSQEIENLCGEMLTGLKKLQDRAFG